MWKKGTTANCILGKEFQLSEFLQSRLTSKSLRQNIRKMAKQALFLWFLFLLSSTSYSRPLVHACTPRPSCTSKHFSCGKFQNIGYPFRLKGDSSCADSSCELVCKDNKTLQFFGSSKYTVTEISYTEGSVRLVDEELAHMECPVTGSSLSPEKISQDGQFVMSSNSGGLSILNCSNEIKDPDYHLLPCAQGQQHVHVYFYVGSRSLDHLHEKCRVAVSLPLLSGVLPENPSFADIREVLQRGFEISCRQYVLRLPKCHMLAPSPAPSPQLPSLRIHLRSSIKVPVLILIGRASLGILFMFGLIVYVIYKKKQASHTNEALGPSRFTYSDIKKITNHFKEKLGQGGYGSVFKGKLATGKLVAVKMLDNARGNGEEFMNEIRTIGRINHVNVVQLVGFCLEKSGCALVYEFMPNGSLDRYVFPEEGEGQHNLSWDKLLSIAQGVAKGIDYLHKDCDMRILHLDIKPHNILLDSDLSPKISDFGLAKLGPKGCNTMSITAARGTAGYMAPELFSRRFGGISYKSDVYSFGMMLLEMAGRRKNVNPYVDHSSQIYYPNWAYGRLVQGADLGAGSWEVAEEEIARKLALVGLWCIQMKPVDRPSMSRVIEMLEGNVQAIELPPKPYLASPEREPTLTDSDTSALLGH